MNYYQGVVADFLEADQAVFLNNEYYMKLEGPLTKGSSWYCDIMAVNLREKAVYLCEVTYSKDLSSLLKRLAAWDNNWERLCDSIRRDSAIPKEWKIQPWVFIPADRKQVFAAKQCPQIMPTPRVTFLETVVPWKYDSDGRTGDNLEDFDLQKRV